MQMISSLPCRFKRYSIPILLCLLLLFPTRHLAAAQTTAAPQPEDLHHWAYAAAFGTGAYRIGGSDMFVVRIVPKFEAFTLGDNASAVNVVLPVTLGLQSLEIDKVFSNPIHEAFLTASFVPGVEWVLPVTKRWALKPYVHLGWGTELEGDASALIYYGGLDSRFRFRWAPVDMILFNGIQWLGYKPDSGEPQSLARLATGLEGDYSLGELAVKGHRLFLKPHLIHYWYFDDLDFRVVHAAPVELNQELEVAVAVGPEEPVAFWFFKLDRIGLGYRKGDNIEGLRFIFASVFD